MNSLFISFILSQPVPSDAVESINKDIHATTTRCSYNNEGTLALVKIVLGSENYICVNQDTAVAQALEVLGQMEISVVPNTATMLLAEGSIEARALTMGRVFKLQHGVQA